MRAAVPVDRSWYRAWAAARPYAYLTPTLVVLAIFAYLPIARLAVMSTERRSVAGTSFVGSENYVRLFDSPLFGQVLWQTLLYVVVTVPVTMALALALALALNQPLRLRAVFRMLFYLPVVMPTVAAAALALWLFNSNNGIVDDALQLVGLPRVEWLTTTTWALPTVMLVGVWKNVGYYMIIYLAGLQALPASVLAAARLDGAGPWDRFWSMTLPLLQPTTYFLAIIALIQSFQVFDFVNLMTQGGPSNATNVLVFRIYQQGFEYLDLGAAAALSLLLFALVSLVSVVLTWAMHR